MKREKGNMEADHDHDHIDTAVRKIQDFTDATPELQKLRLIVVVSDGECAGATHAGYNGDIEQVVMTLLKAAQELSTGTGMGVAIIPASDLESLN